jgi:hypothetical protein
MHVSPLLAPIVALVAWTLVMQVWMYIARIGAMRRAGIDAKRDARHPRPRRDHSR